MVKHLALQSQIHIYGIDTGNFYTNNEARLHWKNHKIKIEKRNLKTEYNKNLEKISEINKKDTITNEDENEIKKLQLRNINIKSWLVFKNEQIKKSKQDLLDLLSNKVNENIKTNGKHHTRHLNSETLSDDNVISVFDSSLTRTLGLKQDEFTDAFMVIQVYYYDMIKDLIYFGFEYKGEKYIYFTSSAGQIRTKKTVFIKESLWNKYEKTIMCGLTIDKINAKGGNNPNKHLAYMALANSATDEWVGFDIDKTIVIDDYETEVYGTYDLIDESDYSITRTNGYVPVPHTDGAGMILPCAFGEVQKNKMVRLSWIKGLLGVFDYVEFIKENNCSPIIKDIYGVEHNIIDEDIQVIFTASQFKMWKFYDSWEEYKKYYKKYKCKAGYTNEEEDRIKNATINYQMLQTFTDFSEDDVRDIAKTSINKLNSLASSITNIKSAYGVTPYNNNMSYIQKAIDIYPNLLNDEYLKVRLRDIKKSLIKKYKSGKLEVKGKYTFILPDFYSACEHWFMGIDNPSGLLDDGEVYCSLFRKSKELDCLRSPHLYKEHAIRTNVAYYDDDISDSYRKRLDKLDKWFTTKAVYTSCKDLISKLLMYDCDGDVSLVVSDESIIRLAKKNMCNVVPLYYNMKKALPVKLTKESIYNGLNSSFKSGNIGQYSNNITKIWNSDTFINGTDEEKQEAIDLVKLLCAENNFCIDSAKTLYMPTRPKDIDTKIKSFTKNQVPYFFMYAKDKEENQVCNKNKSFVNILDDIIPNPRINYSAIELKEIDYTLLMNNQDIIFNIELNDKGQIIEEKTDPLIVKYSELNKKYHYKINSKDAELDTVKCNTVSSLRQSLMFKRVSNEIREELSKFGYNEIEICDILVKYLYGIKKSKHKEVLWFCYGKYIYDNLKRNVKKPTKTIQCKDCGEWFEINNMANRTYRCIECQKKLKYNNKNKNRRSETNTKVVICIDCGKQFYVSNKDTKSCRCIKCKKIYKKHIKNLYRNSIKNQKK